MKLKFDVTAQEYKILRDILVQHLAADVTVWVFGSRAKNTARFNSDIDLALEANAPIPARTMAELKDAFNDASLSYKVDLVDVRKVTDRFAAIIREQSVLFPLKVTKGIPTLRFPEFEGEWEDRTLASVFAHLDAGVSVNSSDRPCGQGEMAVLKTSCVSSGVFNPKENKLVDDPKEVVRLKEPALDGTIIISRMNTPELVGANAYVQGDFPNLFLPDRLWAAKPSPSVQPRWAGYLMALDRIRGALSARASGTSGSMKNLSKDAVYSLPIKAPHPDEQKKIADFLTAVDEKIEGLKRKRELLTDYKRGVMQQIFSQQIRFKRNDGRDFPDWKQKRLGKLGEFRGGGTPDTKIKEYWGGSIPWVSSSDIQEETVRYVEPTRFISETALKDSATILVPKETILIVSRVGVGKVAISRSNICTSQDFCNFTPENMNAIFLAHWLLNHKKILLALRQGTSIKGLTTSDLKAIHVPIPHPDEQHKIADLLSTLDAKIDAVAGQVTQMEALKKSLLQQMFV